MTIWYTSDTHFGHANIIQYCCRPFSSADEMNDTMITNWNSVVRRGDTVFHLGDFGFADWNVLKGIRSRLNGEIVLVPGNHDRRYKLKEAFTVVDHIHEVKDNGQRVVLSHYPILSWNAAYHGAVHLHGHCHGTIKPTSKRIDVGVDCWNFTPVMLDQVMARQVPNVFDQIERIIGESCSVEQKEELVLTLRSYGVFP